MDVMIPFGLRVKVNKIIHISEVESGLACDCICPNCKKKLIARKGEIRAHHFAHYNGEECDLGVETSLHLGAKMILQRHKKLVVPSIYIEFGDRGKIKISREKEISFESINLETKFKDIIPDVTGYINGKFLFIEITVTHDLTKDKIGTIKRECIDTLEINLISYYNRHFELSELEGQ